MPKTCIINYANGGWYPNGQNRLLRSLVDTQFLKLGDIIIFKNESELKCPPHSQLHYGFKIAAFNRAVDLGYKIILWCDAAVWAHKPLKPLFEHIEHEGHVFFTGGWNCAQWTSDACLTQMQVSRDEAEKIPMYMACCMGLNLENPRSVEFLTRLNKYAWDGISFIGAWHNDRHQVSQDARCLGHRHDQSVGSILAYQLGMEHLIGHKTFFTYYNNKAGIPYRYCQQNDLTGIAESVVMLSQGM